MQKGTVRVQTENIFPSSRSFYTASMTFLSVNCNAVDATQKLKTLSSIGEAKVIWVN